MARSLSTIICSVRVSILDEFAPFSKYGPSILTEDACLDPRPPLPPPPPPPLRLGPEALASRMPESSSISPARLSVLLATEFLPLPPRPCPAPPPLPPPCWCCCALARAEKGLPDMMGGGSLVDHAKERERRLSASLFPLARLLCWRQCRHPTWRPLLSTRMDWISNVVGQKEVRTRQTRNKKGGQGAQKMSFQSRPSRDKVIAKPSIRVPLPRNTTQLDNVDLSSWTD